VASSAVLLGAALSDDSVADNRICYGCSNVPVPFYDRHVQTAFANSQAIIYVLSDEKSVQAVFGRYGAGSPAANGLLVCRSACDNRLPRFMGLRQPPTSKLNGAYKSAK